MVPHPLGKVRRLQLTNSHPSQSHKMGWLLLIFFKVSKLNSENPTPFSWQFKKYVCVCVRACGCTHLHVHTDMYVHI